MSDVGDKNRSELYGVWWRMNHRSGAKVCKRWQTFETFLIDVGGSRPSGVGRRDGRSLYSLRLIDGRGVYKPGNVRWVSAKERARNASFSRMLTFEGETFALSEWAERLGINRRTLRNRIERGWSIEAAFTTPIQEHGL